MRCPRLRVAVSALTLVHVLVMNSVLVESMPPVGTKIKTTPPLPAPPNVYNNKNDPKKQTGNAKDDNNSPPVVLREGFMRGAGGGDKAYDDPGANYTLTVIQQARPVTLLRGTIIEKILFPIDTQPPTTSNKTPLSSDFTTKPPSRLITDAPGVKNNNNAKVVTTDSKQQQQQEVDAIQKQQKSMEEENKLKVQMKPPGQQQQQNEKQQQQPQQHPQQQPQQQQQQQQQQQPQQQQQQQLQTQQALFRGMQPKQREQQQREQQLLQQEQQQQQPEQPQYGEDEQQPKQIELRKKENKGKSTDRNTEGKGNQKGAAPKPPARTQPTNPPSGVVKYQTPMPPPPPPPPRPLATRAPPSNPLPSSPSRYGEFVNAAKQTASQPSSNYDQSYIAAYQMPGPIKHTVASTKPISTPPRRPGKDPVGGVNTPVQDSPPISRDQSYISLIVPTREPTPYTVEVYPTPSSTTSRPKATSTTRAYEVSKYLSNYDQSYIASIVSIAPWTPYTPNTTPPTRVTTAQVGLGDDVKLYPNTLYGQPNLLPDDVLDPEQPEVMRENPEETVKMGTEGLGPGENIYF